MKTFKTFVSESLVRQQEKLEENYRTLAQKGIGAERKEDIKVGHGVDYYHPKTGDKHMGKIHSMSDKGYVVKDDKTGEKHSFDYFRKEEVEQEGSELDEASYTGKGNHRPGWMLRADPELAKKFKEKEDLAKKRQAAYGNPAAGKSVKEESELEEEVPIAARALYAQTYAKHGKTASKSSEAKQKAYDAVEKKHGTKVLAQLKAHHEKNMNEESELEEADFSKAQTTMAHTIGKHFKKKGIGDESKGGPFAVASAMVRDKPAAAKKAYATIKAKMKNEEHQDMLMALYDELSEENQETFEIILESNPEKLLSFAQLHFSGE